MWFFIRKTTRLLTYWEIFLRHPENFMIIRHSKYRYLKIMFFLSLGISERKDICLKAHLFMQRVWAISYLYWSDFCRGHFRMNLSESFRVVILKQNWWHIGDWRDSCELFHFFKNKETSIIWQFTSAFMFQNMKIRILM